MSVDLETLQRAINDVFRYLRENGWSEIEITDDYYWDIQEPRDRYDVKKTPSNLTIGQISHDWERILALAEGRALPIGYALVWAASLLRAVGEKVVG